MHCWDEGGMGVSFVIAKHCEKGMGVYFLIDERGGCFLWLSDVAMHAKQA